MSFGNDNFNMLVPLNALLSERSVTGAAKLLHVGQPAMSASLARLRAHYNDELLVRVDNSYLLTPLAESLAEAAAEAVELGARVLHSDEKLDIGDLRRTFTVGMSEHEFDVLGPEIMRRIHARAPQVKVKFDMNSMKHIDDISNHLRKIDCMTLPSEWISGFPRERLFDDRLCLAVAPDHPIPSVGYTMEELDSLRWVATGDGSFAAKFANEMFDYDVPSSHIVTMTDSMNGLTAIVAKSALAGILPRRIVQPMVDSGALRTLQPPRGEVGLTIDLVWHPVRSRDRGLDWLRHMIVGVASSLPPVGGS